MFIALKSLLPYSFRRGVRRILLNIRDSILYQLKRDRLFPRNIRHIVFVCKGNICRSAFAEYYMKTYGIDGTIKFESCGLDVGRCHESPLEAVKIGREFGVELAPHRSKSFDACDLGRADLIVPMEFEQYLHLVAMFPDGRGKIRLLRDFAQYPQRLLCNIYDPFGLGESEFRLCFQKMVVALEELKKNLDSTR
jgi:protein-tyrosine phosphatase